MRRATAALARHAVVALALLIPPAAGRAQLPEGAARRARAALDSIADATVARGRAAGLVGVVVRGADTLVARAYGRADVENDVPLTLGHVFQLASITKQFTAAAVLALVDSGVVALDAPITRYLPDAPVRGQPMTVRQLLGHTSGLPDFAESPRGRAIGRLDVPPDTVLALVRDTPLYFAPGALMRYSNTGFVLLGQLIERASGRPYAAYVEERVLRRAGATGARFCDPEALVPRIARGYALGASGLRPAVFVSPRVPWAAGGFCGTAADLVAWNAGVHAARGGRVLTSASYAELTRAGTVAGGRRTRYGLGVSLVEVAGRRAFQHGGDIAGFTTFTAYLPDDSLSVTVLVNTQGPTRPDVVAAALVHAALGAPHASRTAHASTPRDLAPFTGRFGGDAVFSAVTDGADAPALRLARGPLPPVLLRFAGRDADGWTFTDGRARYTFEPATDAAGSRTLWADLGVALVRWERAR